MKKNNTVISIGKKRMQEIVHEIRVNSGLTKEGVAEKIGLTREGLFHITNRSGRITVEKLDHLKILYKKHTKKDLEIEEKNSNEGHLADYSLEELIAEIKKRGGSVTF